VRKTLRSRFAIALAAVLSVALIAPASASAANSIDYVVVERDGDVTVRSLTTAQPVIVAPLARITSARAVGKNFRIVVAAPQGSRIFLYRNGKAIASGKKTSFSVSIGRAKSAKFHAVVMSGKSFLVTQKVTVGTRAQSTRK